MTPKPENPHRESEIKLLAGPAGLDVHAIRRSAEALGIALGDGRSASRRDVYLDDAGFHLGRAGAGLRVRQMRKGSLLELKVERGGKGRLRERDELSVPFGDLDDRPRRARDLPRGFRDRIEPFVYDDRLRPAVVLRVERTTHDVAAGESAAELCLDRVAVESPHGDSIGTFEEVELEIRPKTSPRAWLLWADALRDDAGLGDSDASKLHRALLLARADATRWTSGGIEPDLDLREAALRTVEGHFRRMQREEVRVRTSDKPESVHKLRVACRRIRATFEIFASCFAPGEVDEFVRTARRTGKAFNDVRDLDVLTQRLDRDVDRLPDAVRSAGARLVDHLRAGRKSMYKDARKALRKKPRLRACGRFQRWIERPHGEHRHGTSVADGAPSLVWQAARHVFALGQRVRRDSPPERLHELRIATKRLRYTAEAFADVYGRDLNRFVERTAHLQEVLGAFQDATIGVARLEALSAIDGLSRRELLAVGAWMGLEQDRGRRAREAFESVWAEFDTDDVRTYLGAALRAPA